MKFRPSSLLVVGILCLTGTTYGQKTKTLDLTGQHLQTFPLDQLFPRVDCLILKGTERLAECMPFPKYDGFA